MKRTMTEIFIRRDSSTAETKFLREIIASNDPLVTLLQRGISLLSLMTRSSVRAADLEKAGLTFSVLTKRGYKGPDLVKFGFRVNV